MYKFINSDKKKYKIMLTTLYTHGLQSRFHNKIIDTANICYTTLHHTKIQNATK